MLFLLQVIFGRIEEMFLHVDLQISPYNSSKRYLGVKARKLGIINEKKLVMNSRIHGLTGTEDDNKYRIFVDGDRICHIDGVVKPCRSNMDGDLWEIEPVFRPGKKKIGYIIRNGKQSSNTCVTQRDWGKRSVVMRKCEQKNTAQLWEIDFGKRMKECEGSELEETYLGKLDRQSTNMQDIPWALPYPLFYF